MNNDIILGVVAVTYVTLFALSYVLFRSFVLKWLFQNETILDLPLPVPIRWTLVLAALFTPAFLLWVALVSFGIFV